MSVYVTRRFVCPDVHSQSDAMAVETALESISEIQSCQIDAPAGVVTLRYASIADVDHIRHQLYSAGFPPDFD